RAHTTNHTMLARLLVAGALLAVGAHASFCGESTIPFSLEILESGQPVLGCARPTCFGWAPSGKPHSHQAAFYRIRGTADGFTRVEDAKSIPPFVQGDIRYQTEQIAHCEPGFGSVSCAGTNSWVGGIAPLMNISAYPTTLRCCVYEALRQSEDRGVATVGGGQIVVGGEVFSGGVQYAFDYISDITKTVNYDQSIQYDVAIRRFACGPLPGPTNVYEKELKPEHGDIRFAPRAYQDPLQSVNQPIPPPQQRDTRQGHGGSHQRGSHSHGSHSHGSHSGSHSHEHHSHSREHVHRDSFEENGVIEEIVRGDGVQLPPGTQFNQQPILPPAPPAQPPVQFFPAPQFTGVASAPVAAQAGGYFPVAYQQGGGFFLCFSRDMTVQMADGSEKRMDQLEKDDFVMSLTPTDIVHVPVTFWLHRSPETMAEFHRFETEDGRTIKLTAQHYIYKGDCSNVGRTMSVGAVSRFAVYAEEVSEGDCLYTVDGENVREVRVVKADRVVEQGIYAPMTSNGKIIVGGVYASCHTSVHSHGIQNTYFGAINRVRDLWTSVFGKSDNSFVDTPFGLELFKSMLDLIAPKGLTTF
ncbi:hypothetical protein PRIPAC_80297, partial [Pristionchus pacificus]